MSDTKLTREQQLEAIQKQFPELTRKANRLIVKTNKSGGLYIKHPGFVEFSKNKNKEYLAGLNIQMNTAKVLFNDERAIKAIRDFLNSNSEEVKA